MELRPYQQEAVYRTREAFRLGCKRPLLVLPTGAGKSVIVAEIIRLAVEKGSKVLWLVHRRNLVFQMREVLEKFGVETGIIMAGEESDTSKPVQLATVQTYSRRLDLDANESNRFFVKADLVITDEAHRSISKKYLSVLKNYSRMIGVTATPCRSDGRGLGEVYDELIDVIGVKELTDMGFLSPVRYFCPSEVDLSKIKIVRGDYDVKELGQKMNRPKLIGDVVEQWIKHAENRQTIIFAVNVAHSISIRDAFLKAGIRAEHLDAHSTDEERDSVFRNVQSGDTRVVTNVALYQEGMDVPDLGCVQMARPTKSIGLYKQCCGRGMRPSEAYEDMILIDHGGVVAEHGFLDEKLTWSLDGKSRAWNKSPVKKEKKPTVCSFCGQVFEGRNTCPECGSPCLSFGKPILTDDSDLQEVGKSRTISMAEKRMWFGMFEDHRLVKGYRPGWSANQYRQKFGVWPRGMDSVAPIPPTQEFKNWIRHIQIKWAKSKNANRSSEIGIEMQMAGDIREARN